MAKSNRIVKMGKWEYTEEEFERQYAEAKRRGEERLRTEPRAKSAHYDPATKRLVIELLNGCVFICPTDLMQGLRGASAEDLTDFKLMPRGFDLHWKKLDAQFTVAGLLNGEFGTRAWMAELERDGWLGRAAPKRAAAKARARRGATTADAGRGRKKREAVDRHLAQPEMDSQRILDELVDIPGDAEKKEALKTPAARRAFIPDDLGYMADTEFGRKMLRLAEEITAEQGARTTEEINQLVNLMRGDDLFNADLS